MVVSDLGSNTIRFLEYDCQKEKRIKEFEKIIRTAEGLIKTKKISNEAVERIFKAIDEAKERLKFKECIGVATSAFRVARNGKEIIEKINQRGDCFFKIISEKEEAHLAFSAVQHFLKRGLIYEKRFVTVDLGGGSTEIIFYHNKQVIFKSFKVGIVTIANRCKGKNLNICIEKHLKKIYKFIKREKAVNLFVAIAGTPTTMVAFKKGIDYQNYNFSKINGEELKEREIDKILQQLLRMPFKEREKWVGVGRSDLIVVGVKILQKIFQQFKLKKIKVVDDSIREALAFKNCKKK